MQGAKQSARPSFSAAHTMPIRVYDQAGNVIATDEHAAQFKE
jgi:hypothetical protein